MRSILPLLSCSLLACLSFASDKTEWGPYRRWDQEHLTVKVIELYVSELSEQRRLAATLIGMLNLQVEPETASAVIGTLLKDPSSKVRLEALYACSYMSLRELRPLVPLIRERTKDSDDEIKNVASHVSSEAESKLDQAKSAK